MFGLNKNKLSDEFISNIIKNSILSDRSLYVPGPKMSGINLSFKDGSSAMLWAYDKGEKYFINFKMFDGIYKIHLTAEQGDQIWMRFMDKFGPTDYSIIEV